MLSSSVANLGGVPNRDNRYIWRDDWLECHRLVDPVVPVPVRASRLTERCARQYNIFQLGKYITICFIAYYFST